MAQELLKKCHLRSGKPGLCFKADLKKAFDSVSRKFIKQSLIHRGFPRSWIHWIDACISKPYFSILIKGQSHGFFKSTSGLRQGDPLSPYLFTLAMDHLSFILQRKAQEGSLKTLDSSPMNISCLLFADDVLVISKDDDRSIAAIREEKHLRNSHKSRVYTLITPNQSWSLLKVQPRQPPSSKTSDARELTSPRRTWDCHFYPGGSNQSTAKLLSTK